mmetsp:Transcript_12861/g.37027  ORF Transcript_12861/g.37027 Transcript_12861/m.37027 type:complete len:202 (-) Transcript_12861:57-662(-)
MYSEKRKEEYCSSLSDRTPSSSMSALANRSRIRFCAGGDAMVSGSVPQRARLTRHSPEYSVRSTTRSPLRSKALWIASTWDLSKSWYVVRDSATLSNEEYRRKLQNSSSRSCSLPSRSVSATSKACPMISYTFSRISGSASPLTLSKLRAWSINSSKSTTPSRFVSRFSKSASDVPVARAPPSSSATGAKRRSLLGRAASP